MKKTNVHALTEGAIMVAAAAALGFLKLFQLPQGGSISIEMLPIFLFCSRWGWKQSFLCSFAYALLQLILDGAYAWGPTSMLLDYFLAFGILGTACFFHRQKGGILVGATVACLLRFGVHFLSGITIYRIYEPTAVFHHTFTDPYLYSAIYNGGFMLPDWFACMILLIVLRKPLEKIK